MCFYVFFGEGGVCFILDQVFVFYYFGECEIEFWYDKYVKDGIKEYVVEGSCINCLVVCCFCFMCYYQWNQFGNKCERSYEDRVEMGFCIFYCCVKNRSIFVVFLNCKFNNQYGIFI